eukprot:scaffold3001_cov98-Skeletonema_marinoi.AAC.3
MERWSCWHFDRCTLPPKSTKAKHPSSHTETLCIETEFESYRACCMERWCCWHFGRCTLAPASTKAKHPLSCWHFDRCTIPPFRQRWKDGLVGTSTAAHFLLHRQRRSIHNLMVTSTAAH